MTGDELLILNRVAHLTPRQLAEHPAARTLFVRLASGRLKRDLAAQLGQSARELHDRVMGLEMADELDGGRELRLRLEEQTKDLPPTTQAEARARLTELERNGLLRSPWKPDVPLRDHPLLGATMARAEVQAIAALAKLTDDGTEALAETARSVAAIDGPMLQRLVRARKMDDADAGRVAHFATLHHFLDGRFALIEVVEKKTDTAPRALARKDATAWAGFINTAHEVPPPGRSVAGWARQIARRYAAVFPTDALLARLELDKELPTQLKTASPEQMRRLANRYPGLELRTLLFKGGAKAMERAAWVYERVGLLERLREFNRDTELLALDYSPGSDDLGNILSGGFTPIERGMVLETFRVYQRVLRIAPEPESGRALLEAGYDSAAAVVRGGPERFLTSVELPEDEARRLYDRARDLAVNGTATLGAVMDRSASPTAGDAPGDAVAALLERGKHEQNCPHCRSLTGLPAYIADLLGLVEDRVEGPIWGERADDPRGLKQRRPDLWTVPLGCATLDERVPTLDVVNALLERAAGGEAVRLDAERLERLLVALGSSRAEVAAAIGRKAPLGYEGDDLAQRVRELDAKLGLGADEAAAVADKLGRSPLFDRLFNLPQLVESGGPWPREGEKFIHPALRPAGSKERQAPVPDLPRLLAGLRVSDGELISLLHALAFWLGFDPDDDNEEGRGFVLTRASLSVLHRHARLVRHTGRSVDELFQILKLAGITGGAISSLAEVEAVLELHAWLADSGITVDELAWVLGRRPARPERLPSASAIAAAVATEAAQPRPVPLGELIAQLLVDPEPDEGPEHAVAARLGIGVDKLAALEALAGTRVATDGVEPALQKILPLSVLLKHPAFDAAAIRWLEQNGACFGVDWKALDLAGVRRLLRYPSLIEDGASPEDLHLVLCGDTDPARLGRVVDADPGLVADLRARLILDVKWPAVPAEGMALLARAAELARRLGLRGEAVVLLASDQPADQRRAADALMASLRARHAGEDAFRDALAPVEDGLREARRDALVARLRAIRGAPADLSGHFLLDVGAGGGARASRQSLAVDSLRLYIERCRAGREEEVPAGAISDRDWLWRRSYRGWQTRRLLFLRPAEFLDEADRAGKTPLFAAFEQALAGDGLSEEAVLAACGRYLAGFDELAGLEIAGVFHEFGQDSGDAPERDRLHLIGSNGTRLFHRAIDGVAAAGTGGAVRSLHASPWVELDLAPGVRKVAPIVYRGRPYLFWADYRTRPRQELKNGMPRLSGYRHELVVRLSTMGLDGRWLPPGELALGDGAVIDDPLGPQGVPRFDALAHDDVVQGYRPRGPGWDDVSVDVDPANGALVLTAKNNAEGMYRVVDLVRRDARAWPATFWAYQPSLPPSVQLLCARRGSTRKLYAGRPPTQAGTRDAAAGLYLDEARIDALRADVGDRVRKDGLYARELATLDPGDDLMAVRGSFTDAVLVHKGDVLLLQGCVREDGGYRLTRLGTTIGDAIAARVLTHGVTGLYDPAWREGLGEAELDLSITAAVDAQVPSGALDLDGPWADYLREIFVHIPLLAADRLARCGRYEAAAAWLKRAGAVAGGGAFEAYRRAPWDAHAIARSRPGALAAFARARSIDLLVAWADRLLAEGATGEARALYLQAGDLLGARPAVPPRCDAEGASYEGLDADLGAARVLMSGLETASAARSVSASARQVQTATVLRPRMDAVRMAEDGRSGHLSTFGARVAAEADGDEIAGFGWSLLRAAALGFWLPDDPLAAQRDRVEERLARMRS